MEQKLTPTKLPGSFKTHLFPCDFLLSFRDFNTQEIVKLVELVLGVMVESEHKNEYIGNIMKLDEATQHELMVILEGVRLLFIIGKTPNAFF